MKVSTTLSLSCVLLGLAAVPTLAQKTDDHTGEANRPQTLAIKSPKKAVADHGPIRMAPVSVLPDSLKKGQYALCQDKAEPYYPQRANGVTIGGFIPVGAPGNVNADIGVSLSVERIVSVGDKTSVVVGLRYSHYGYSINTPGVNQTGDINLISPTVGYRYRLGANKRFYVEPSIGVVFVTGRTFGSSNTTDFAYGIAGGYDMPNNLYADLRYVAGGNDAEMGFIFSLGTHF